MKSRNKDMGDIDAILADELIGRRARRVLDKREGIGPVGFIVRVSTYQIGRTYLFKWVAEDGESCEDECDGFELELEAE